MLHIKHRLVIINKYASMVHYYSKEGIFMLSNKKILGKMAGLVLAILGLITLFLTSSKTEKVSSDTEPPLTRTTIASSSLEPSTSQTDHSESSSEGVDVETTVLAISEEMAIKESAVTSEAVYTTASDTGVSYDSVAYTSANTEVTETVTYTSPEPSYSASPVLANGNTAGAIGSSAAAQMAAATGVSQSTWEAIIARESNGDPNAANASGASGLFQTMPGWGSTATVQDQINAAVNAYNAQGLAAWGY